MCTSWFAVNSIYTYDFYLIERRKAGYYYHIIKAGLVDDEDEDEEEEEEEEDEEEEEEEEDDKQCWVCFANVEDDPTAGWVHPCRWVS